MKMPKNEPKKAFVWYSLRISFVIMILLWVVIYLLLPGEYSVPLLLIDFWLTISIFTFIVSILHINEYKRKTFAIIALILSFLSSLILFFSFIGLLV